MKIVNSSLVLICSFYLFGFGTIYAQTINSSTSGLNKVEELLEKAEFYKKTSPDSVDVFATKALVLSNEFNFELGKAKANLLLANNCRERNHNVAALDYYYPALNYYSSIDDSLTIHEIYMWLGLCLAFETYYDSGQVLLSKSSIYFKKIQNYELAAQCYINFYRLYKGKDDFKGALKSCLLAKEMADKTDNNLLKWKINNYTGYMYLNLSKYKEAMVLFHATLPEIPQYSNNPDDVYRLLYFAAELSFYMKDFDKVIKYNLYAITTAKKIPNKSLSDYFVGLSCRSIGKAYNKMGKYDSAYYFLYKAKNNIELNKDQHSIGPNMSLFGDIFFNKGEYDSALWYYNKSLYWYIQNQEIEGEQLIYNNMGKTFFSKGNKKLALKYFLRAMHDSVLNADDEIFMESCDYLSRLYEFRGNYQKAFYYQKAYTRFKERFYNQENIKNIIRLEVDYEYKALQNKRDFEVEQKQLSLESEIKQNKLRLNLVASGFVALVLLTIFIYRSYVLKKKLNQEKEILLKEIHHRVKNNLQVISSMLSLQSSSVTDEKIKSVVNDSQGRVKSMALIHQMLYQNENLSAIDMREYVFKLVKAIESSFLFVENRIKLETNIGNFLMDIDTAVPLGLIVNELITNSYKYAFPNQKTGKVLIFLSSIENTRYRLVISDTGIGLSESIINQNFNNTLGLRMVKILAKQLKGKLEIHSKNGAEFVLEFSELIKGTKRIESVKNNYYN